MMDWKNLLKKNKGSFPDTERQQIESDMKNSIKNGPNLAIW